MKLLYILNGKIPVLAKDVQEWGQWMSFADRYVAFTELPDATISTVFVGIDHDFRFGLEPVLFETMVFGGMYNNYVRRYISWADAEAGHKETVDMARKRKLS